MKTSKKVLCVVVALAMLVNVFAMFSFAAAPESAVDLTLSVDKAAYSAGDVVTITVHEKVEPVVGDMRIGGTYAIGYDSAVINPLSTSDDITQHGFTCFKDGLDIGNSGAKYDFLDLGDTIDEGYGWNSVYGIVLADDVTNLVAFDATAGVDLFSFQMKLADNVADGDYVIGFNKGSFVNYSAYANDNANGGIYGEDDKYYGTTDNYGCGTVTIHVGAAVTPLTLTYGGAQIRFDDVGENGTYDTHKDGKFDVRTIAKISTEDFLAAFGSEDGAKDPTKGIKEFGFVYRAKSKDAKNGAFSLDTAKGIVDGTKTDATYEKVSLEYIQRTSDGYLFTCVINDIADTDIGDGVNCLAFVKYGPGEGQYVFFDDVKTADYTELHTTRVPGYKA